MIIISDCVKNNLDEGCIKLASSLSKRLKKCGAFLIAVNTDCQYADAAISANKFFSDRELYESIEAFSGNILYIPFASNTLGTAVRTWNLSRKTRKKVNVLFTMRWQMNFLTKALFRKASCNIITVSQDSYAYFKDQFPMLNVYNVKTGVDTNKFIPVEENEKTLLRKKYGIPTDKTVLLHVGHLKYGRNIDKFLSIDDKYHVVLVFSSITEKDEGLKKLLEEKHNVQIIEEYLPNVEEIYQASDIYVFPIVEENNSIDIPLSVLEAAACNLKLITTDYKEISFFKDAIGFTRVRNDQLDHLNTVLSEIENVEITGTRTIALEYSWDDAVRMISELI